MMKTIAVGLTALILTACSLPVKEEMAVTPPTAVEVSVFTPSECNRYAEMVAIQSKKIDPDEAIEMNKNTEKLPDTYKNMWIRFWTAMKHPILKKLSAAEHGAGWQMICMNNKGDPSKMFIGGHWNKIIKEVLDGRTPVGQQI